eukprot:5057592-Amphidinium_carterae.2
MDTVSHHMPLPKGLTETDRMLLYCGSSKVPDRITLVSDVARGECLTVGNNCLGNFELLTLTMMIDPFPWMSTSTACIVAVLGSLLRLFYTWQFFAAGLLAWSSIIHLSTSLRVMCEAVWQRHILPIDDRSQ